MVEVLDQEFLKYLYEAEQCLLQIKPVDDFQLIFEENDPQVQQQVQQNNKNYGKAEGFLSKAANAVLGIIRSVINAIQSFLSYSFASKENKLKFQQFKQKCLADPALANKTITYMDYQNQFREYDNAIKQAEDVDALLAQGQDVEVDGIISNITNLVKGAAKGVATSIGLRSLEQICNADQGTAEAVERALNYDQSLIGQFMGMDLHGKIAGAVGEENLQKFKTNVAYASGKNVGFRVPIIGKRLSLRRAIVELRRKKSQTLGGVMGNIVDELKKTFTNPFTAVFSTKFGKLKYASGNEGIQQIANNEYTQIGKNIIMNKAKGIAVDKIKDATKISKVENMVAQRRHEKALKEKNKTLQKSRSFWMGGN